MLVRRIVALTSLFAFVFCGCWNPYRLPDPPPPAERKDVSLIPGEEERAKERLYLEARASAIQLHSLLSQQRYVEASALMSSETKAFLAAGGDTSKIADILASGKMKLPDGQVVEFEPVSMLLADDLSQLKDSVAGQEEQETDNRKELFALLPDNKAQKIVMIREAGKWVLHRTRLPKTIDVPSPKS